MIEKLRYIDIFEIVELDVFINTVEGNKISIENYIETYHQRYLTRREKNGNKRIALLKQYKELRGHSYTYLSDIFSTTKDNPFIYRDS